LRYASLSSLAICFDMLSCDMLRYALLRYASLHSARYDINFLGFSVSRLWRVCCLPKANIALLGISQIRQGILSLRVPVTNNTRRRLSLFSNLFKLLYWRHRTRPIFYLTKQLCYVKILSVKVGIFEIIYSITRGFWKNNIRL